jgi:hypothetical protein
VVGEISTQIRAEEGPNIWMCIQPLEMLIVISKQPCYETATEFFGPPNSHTFSLYLKRNPLSADTYSL